MEEEDEIGLKTIQLIMEQDPLEIILISTNEGKIKSFVTKLSVEITTKLTNEIHELTNSIDEMKKEFSTDQEYLEEFEKILIASAHESI